MELTWYFRTSLFSAAWIWNAPFPGRSTGCPRVPTINAIARSISQSDIPYHYMPSPRAWLKQANRNWTPRVCHVTNCLLSSHGLHGTALCSPIGLLLRNFQWNHNYLPSFLLRRLQPHQRTSRNSWRLMDLRSSLHAAEWSCIYCWEFGYLSHGESTSSSLETEKP